MRVGRVEVWVKRVVGRGAPCAMVMCQSRRPTAPQYTQSYTAASSRLISTHTTHHAPQAFPKLSWLAFENLLVIQDRWGRGATGGVASSPNGGTSQWTLVDLMHRTP